MSEIHKTSIKRKVFSLILAIAVCTGFILFLLNKKPKEVYKMHSPQNEAMQGDLILSAKPTSKDMASGTICLEQISKVTKVDLFMPDMGHGSAPPEVSKTAVPSLFSDQKDKADYGCLQVDQMELFMPGLWQVRVFHENGIFGIFDLNLQK